MINSITFFLLILCETLLFAGSTAFAVNDKPYTVSASMNALAANAGGQEAYALRIHHDDAEYHVFANRSLSVGGKPLVGAGYDLRFNLCEDCFWRVFIQGGAGLSNAGPYVELDWGMAIPIVPLWLPTHPPRYLPQLRIDFATHLIFSQLRPNTWSYPLWLGIAVPF